MRIGSSLLVGGLMIGAGAAAQSGMYDLGEVGDVTREVGAAVGDTVSLGANLAQAAAGGLPIDSSLLWFTASIVLIRVVLTSPTIKSVADDRVAERQAKREELAAQAAHARRKELREIDEGRGDEP